MPPPAAPDEDWVGTAYAAKRLGVSQVTIWRQIKHLPHLRVGRGIRLPSQFVEDAYSAVMAGGAVVLSEFAREWPARQGTSSAVRSINEGAL